MLLTLTLLSEAMFVYAYDIIFLYTLKGFVQNTYSPCQVCLLFFPFSLFFSLFLLFLLYVY
ncbi:hypothetical protein HOY80DRAFT_976901 [Tuber brumale]|nr:hypothetical protein HOY80DRAFT_976901 [Tuber brumale]